MTSVTIKNIPDELVERLKREAVKEHRSLNKQIIATLEHAVPLASADAKERLDRARKTRKLSMGTVLSADEVQEAIRQGRRGSCSGRGPGPLA